MVHLKDTEATLAAVMRSERFPGLLAHALLAILVLSILALEWSDHALGDTARVWEGRPDVTEVGHEAKTIEGDEVEEAFHCQWNPLDELLVDQRLLVPVENVGSIPNVLSVHDQ